MQNEIHHIPFSTRVPTSSRCLITSTVPRWSELGSCSYFKITKEMSWINSFTYSIPARTVFGSVVSLIKYGASSLSMLGSISLVMYRSITSRGCVCSRSSSVRRNGSKSQLNELNCWIFESSSLRVLSTNSLRARGYVGLFTISRLRSSVEMRSNEPSRMWSGILLTADFPSWWTRVWREFDLGESSISTVARTVDVLEKR